MNENLEGILNDIEDINSKLKLLDEFIKSDIEKTEALNLLASTFKNFMIDTDRRIKDLESFCVSLSNTNQSLLDITSAQTKTILNISDTLLRK